MAKKSNVSKTISVLIRILIFSMLKTRTEVVLETLVFSPFNQFTRLATSEFLLLKHFIVTKVNRLMLLKEVTTVYNENHTKCMNTCSVTGS
jgi:branched-subunit amino acid transport protein